MTPMEIRHFHLFCGLGGGARGFNHGQARVGNLQAHFRCIGGVDNDPAGLRDFEHLAGVKGTLLDMFDREQYIAFHGMEPPTDWREATPQDIQRAAGGERPHIVFLSAPCKGFSGLLAESKSKTDKYQALNRLTLRGVWLMLEAWHDDPPELVIFENVPRLATRGRALLDRITSMLRSYGYATAETTHDCGELGGLAESRKRFLLVARNIEKVPPFLYEPPKRPLQAVGTVLGRMPLPGDVERAGPMHRIPSLQWKTWVRLAFVEAGSDWRSLNRLAVDDGRLRDYLIVPEMNGGVLGVRTWDEPTGTVAGHSLPSNGAFSVADPRGPAGAAEYSQYGVLPWDRHMGVVSGQSAPGGGMYSVADPRHAGGPKFNNMFHVTPFASPSSTITGARGVGQCVADPRPGWNRRPGNYRVVRYDQHAGTVIAGGKGVQGGWQSVADPRTGMSPDRSAYLTGGHYGVVPWDGHTGAVSGSACLDNGPWSVADPRMPAASDNLVCRITAEDGTWHRPFTTFELAAIQTLIDPEEQVELDGLSDQAWRERIGNAVPSDAAAAIASEMGRTLLLAWSGETFQLSSTPIWVRNAAVALSVAQPEEIAA